MISKVCIKKSVKAFICGALIANLSMGTIISANAQSSAQSISFSVSHYGYTYNVYNLITTGSDSQGKYARAGTYIGGVDGVTIPAGYMGAQARLYDSSGNLKAYSNMKYNSSGTISMMNTETYRSFTGSPSFYSEGLVEVWMGTGYYRYGTVRTPNLNDYT